MYPLCYLQGLVTLQLNCAALDIFLVFCFLTNFKNLHFFIYQIINELFLLAFTSLEEAFQIHTTNVTTNKSPRKEIWFMHLDYFTLKYIGVLIKFIVRILVMLSIIHLDTYQLIIVDYICDNIYDIYISMLCTYYWLRIHF